MNEPRMIWVAYAIYGPRDTDPIIVAALTESLASLALSAEVSQVCNENELDPNEWIEEEPFQVPLVGEPLG